ncbi:MAG: 5-deoxy-glucuronate isomerase [Candidatus Lokiarchaeota archaeon]|nr:5-deoxy-glucuronate isomerase [Candidatus Lokiarchaeota archaeon]
MNWVVRIDELPWDDPRNAKMDFGIIVLGKNQAFAIDQALEKAVLPLDGEISLSWKEGETGTGSEKKIKRASIFDEDPHCLHAPAGVTVSITSISERSEVAVFMTRNEAHFPPKLYLPSECRSELRGKGSMRETSTRVVRTIFDIENAPHAKLVLGEVINYPGKWSSYSPHRHPQPEIYHYRFLPENGFGACFLGDDVVKVGHGDTVKILGVTHPQTSAPGYAMFYIWAIRHLDGNPYGSKFGTPIFDPEHVWVMKAENEKKIWPQTEG